MHTLICDAGLAAINDSMDSLLVAMRQNPFEGSSIASLARVLGACFALMTGAYECYMMMLGKRMADVMKLGRILLFSVLISCSGWIVSGLDWFGSAMEDVGRGVTETKQQTVVDKEEELLALEVQYADSLLAALARGNIYLTKIANNSGIETEAEEFSTWDYIQDLPGLFADGFKALLASGSAYLSYGFNVAARFIGEVVFQLAFYGTMLLQRVSLCLLGLFCPLAFAFSLVGPFKNAWQEWLSKYISISLWGFVLQIGLYYVCAIMEWSLDSDIETYKALISNVSAATGLMDILSAGMSNIGTAIMYLVAMLVGARVLAKAPEMASWLIPGGANAGMGADTMAGARGSMGTIAAGSGMAARAAGTAGGPVGKGAVVVGSAVGRGVGKLMGRGSKLKG